MPILRNLAVAMTVAVMAASPLCAQVAPPSSSSNPSGEYRPSQRNPGGREVVAVFISGSQCIANQDPAFHPAVREMMRRLGVQRDSLGIRLSIMGVANDWDTRTALAYLQGFGEFDEMAVGRNWFNTGMLRYVWQADGGRPSIPQVILLERTFDLGDRVTVSPERVLERIVGGDEIRAWVARGAPLPSAAIAASGSDAAAGANAAASPRP